MNALLGLLIILTSFQVLAAPSLVAFLSQKTNEIRELELCEKASAKEAAQLSKTCVKETNSKSFDAISEQLFFDAAAREQIKAYDCVEKQAQDLLVSSDKNSNDKKDIAQDFAIKIEKMRRLRRELEPIEDRLSEMQREEISSPLGETQFISSVDDKERKSLQKRQTQLRTGLKAIEKSFWQGHHYLVQEYIQNELKAKTFDAQKFTAKFLKSDGEQSFASLLKKISNSSGPSGLTLSAMSKLKIISNYV